MKPKPFRLPRNWADKLSVDDVREILKHWQSRVAYWEWQLLMDEPAERDLRICQARVRLWMAVLDRRQSGQPCQELLDACRHVGSEFFAA
jgi:hypothetical protein